MRSDEPTAPTHVVTSQTAVEVRLHVPNDQVDSGEDGVGLWLNDEFVILSRQNFRHFAATVEQAGRQVEAVFERAPSRGIEPTA